MDLQAILDEVDSSSESSGKRLGEVSSNDLERILREDEEETDEDLKNSTAGSLSTSETPTNHYHFLSSLKTGVLDSSLNYDGDALSYGEAVEESNGVDRSKEDDRYTTGSHNAEDWAVLQQILGEDDRDYDDDGLLDRNSVPTTPNLEKESFSFTSNNPEVDAILDSVPSDDEGDLGSPPSSELPNWSHTETSMHEQNVLTTSWSQEERPRPVSPMPITESLPTNYPHTATTLVTESAAQSDEQAPQLSDAELLALTESAVKYAESYERRLLRAGHRDIVSPLHVKRRMKPRYEVGTRNQQKVSKEPKEKTNIHQSTAQAQFEFSGLMESKALPKISSYLLQPESKHGLPTALAINSKFIAIGFQKGIVCVFDLFEVLRQRLGVVVDKSGSENNVGNVGSVSSIDMSLNGEALVAGYTSGAVVLWDVIKGSILRSVTESHPSPITMVRFLTDRDTKVVSVDAGGLVLKLTFAKNILWSNYTMDTECLLDGAAGQILAMNILPPLSSIDSSTVTISKNAQHPFLRQLVLIALSSERSSFAVAVEPSINVLHRWARPPPERIRPPKEGVHQPTITELPCLTWGWALVSGGGHVVTPILARAWGCCVQLLHANFPDSASTTNEEEGPFWPAFGVHDEFDVASPVVALEWLGQRSLVYLTVTNEFTVVDTVMMTLVERLDFSGLKLVYAEFSLSRSANKEDEGTVSVDFCTTFQNSVRFSDDRILVLCQEEIKSVSILGATQRISALEQDGEWLEAMALALDHYENTIKSQEDRKRDPDGKRDLSKHPEFSSVIRSEDEEWISKLLLRYVGLAIENAPESNDSISDDVVQSPSRRIDLAQSHFQMLAGVCIEFCVVTRRLDILFGQIFRRFYSVGYTSVFLDVLEPYVLNDKLSYIAPEAMAHFVEHCKATNGVATVERCLLHMDVTIMDFDNILHLLQKNEMYSALVHVYTHGLDDYVAPLEILLERVFDSADDGNVTSTRRRDGVPQSPFEKIGYKAILYLRRCFEGKTFTREAPLKPDDRLQSLRPQLLKVLLTEGYTPSTNVKDKSNQATIFGQRAFQYPYTHVLLMVDARAFLDALGVALDAPDAEFMNSETVFESVGGWEVEVDTQLLDPLTPVEEADESNGPEDGKRCPSIQRIMNMLSTVILPEDGVGASSTFGTLGQSKEATNAFLDFLAKYLVKGVARASKATTFLIVSRMTERFVSTKLDSVRASSQEQLIELITALPRNAYDPDDVLALVDSAGINRASLLLHQEGVSSWLQRDENMDRRAEHLRRAIDCYLNDDEPDFQRGVFTYVKKECTAGSGLSDSSQLCDDLDNSSTTLRGALGEKLPDLVHLDPLLSAQLVAELFIEELDEVIESLGRDGVAQFKFLHAIISGDLTKADTVAGPVLSANLTMDQHQAYLALMAKLHPDTVYHYLSTHDNYRPEECLKLCQDYDIADASAYVLERMGNVSSALQLVLQTLEARLMGLKRVVRGMSTDSYENNLMKKIHRDWNKDLDPNTKKGKEVKGVKRILVVALDLCERNSGSRSLRSEQSSQLWFNVLDRLINAKGFLRLSKEKPDQAKIMSAILSELLQLTMQRMVSSVPLPDLVRKVTTEHSGTRLGEFREMIASMLNTYGFEHNVCMGAVNVMNHDIKSMERNHRRLKIEGSRVQSIMNRELGDHPLSERLGIQQPLRDIDTNLVLRNHGDADFSDHAMLHTSRTSRGLQNVRSRLRSRRHGDSESRGPWDCTKSSLNLMTVSDQLYQKGESSEAAAFGERFVGVLGTAEHYGRLGFL